MGNPGSAGAGGLIRNHLGEWIAGFSRNLGWTTNTVAELWALRDGLPLNISQLFIVLDAKVIVDLLNKKFHDAHPCSPVLNCSP